MHVGLVCYVHVSRTNRTKPDQNARKCIFVGYESYREGLEKHEFKDIYFTISKNVVFDEEIILIFYSKCFVLGDDKII